MIWKFSTIAWFSDCKSIIVNAEERPLLIFMGHRATGVGGGEGKGEEKKFFRAKGIDIFWWGIGIEKGERGNYRMDASRWLK